MKLNIGCGEKFIDGWVNIDKYPSKGSIIFGDIQQGLIYDDSVADEILLDNVIEHIQSIPDVMREAHRLLKSGGKIHIFTPHYTSNSSWRDPTHVHHLSFFSFDMFCKERNSHYLGGALFRISKKKLSFGGGISCLGRLIFNLSPEIYERKFCYLFPASTLYVCLEAVK